MKENDKKWTLEITNALKACVDKIESMAVFNSAAAEYGQYCDDTYRVRLNFIFGSFGF